MNSSKGKLTDFHETVRKEAEDSVKNFFPDRVFELDKLLKSDMFSVDAVEMVQKAVTVPINKNDGHIDVEPSHKKRKSLMVLNLLHQIICHRPSKLIFLVTSICCKLLRY